MTDFRITEPEWKQVVRDVSETKDALLGTMTEAGYISKTEAKFVELFRFKKIINTTFIWLARVTVSAVIVAVIGGIITCIIY